MRISQPPAAPSEPLQIIPLPELVELHLDGGIEQAQLHEKFVCNRGRFGKSQDRWKKVRKVKVQIAQGLDELLDGWRLRIGQIDLIIQLFAQRAPIQFDEGVFLGDLAYHRVGDPGALTQTSQMQLAHFSAAAHIVHQVIGIAFAANEGHRPPPTDFSEISEKLFLGRSVRVFHYRRQVSGARNSQHFAHYFFAATNWNFC